eukprot:scaffold1564_cov389-Prasinococcus_capsulatus_cf.AAC.11
MHALCLVANLTITHAARDFAAHEPVLTRWEVHLQCLGIVRIPGLVAEVAEYLYLACHQARPEHQWALVVSTIRLRVPSLG